MGDDNKLVDIAKDKAQVVEDKVDEYLKNFDKIKDDKIKSVSDDVGSFFKRNAKVIVGVVMVIVVGIVLGVAFM